jgi:nucleoid-associated protein EbfC
MSDQKMPDLNNLMKMAQELQGNVSKMQEQLAQMQVEASSGGGMVTATVNGQFELVALKIEPGAIDPNDPGMLQDLVVAAVNQANAKMRDKAKEEMSKLTGGLNLPGGMPMPF